MLNAIQYIVSIEAVGEKEELNARKAVRQRLNEVVGTSGVWVPGENDVLPDEPPVNDAAIADLPPGTKIHPPLKPVMQPVDGTVPFPHLDPPVG